MIRLNRTAIVIGALMCAASIGAVVARPAPRAPSTNPAFSLEAIIPKQFGNWHEEPQRIVQIVNPQQQASLDDLYSQIVTRNYVNTDGYWIMLSVAYGSDQRALLRAHEPAACYLAAGFMLRQNEAAIFATPFGEIPVRRLLLSKGPRVEPVTYWLRIGEKAVTGWQRRLVELSYTLTGRTPDGILFRISSIDPDQARAKRMQNQFITQLLEAMSPTERQRLTGLGES